MKLPTDFVNHLNHRITVLMTFTVRRDVNFFGQGHGESKERGDVYRAALEGSGIMLRMLLEFLGVKADRKNPKKLVQSDERDTILGFGKLDHIHAVKIDELDPTMVQFLAKMHNEASKRTAHPKFHEFTLGLDPDELRKATRWIVAEIWERCYKPEPITVDPDLFHRLKDGKWEDIPFKPGYRPAGAASPAN